MAQDRRNPWSGRRNSGPRERPMPAWAGGPRRRFPPRWRTGLNLLLLVLSALVAAWLQATDPPPDRPARLAGRVAYVVDGDTLDLAGHRVRLAGMDAPERKQTCETADGRPWACGEAARTALRDATRSVDLTCDPRDTDRYGRIVATCAGPAGDLGRQLVATGLAVSLGDYGLEEIADRAAARGVWQGTFQRPADWRRDHQPGAAPPSRFQRLVDWLLSLFDS